MWRRVWVPVWLWVAFIWFVLACFAFEQDTASGVGVIAVFAFVLVVVMTLARKEGNNQ